MRVRLEWVLAAAFCTVALHVSPALAQPGSTPDSQPATATDTIACASKPGERQHCAADTAAGVVLMTSTGTAECLLGKTWGYDDKGVWVSDGCGGEFLLGATTVVGATPGAPREPAGRIEEFGEFAPGNGFPRRTEQCWRAVHQRVCAVAVCQPVARRADLHRSPRQRAPVDGRNDFYPHRIMVFFKGLARQPEADLQHHALDRQHHRPATPSSATSATSSAASSASTPGSTGTRARARSRARIHTGSATTASWPTSSSGPSSARHLGPGRAGSRPLVQRWSHNNSSSLGVKTSQLDRSFTTGASVWWMPTTKEFGPKGRLRRLGDAREGGHPVRLLHGTARSSASRAPRAVLPKTPPSGWPTA
jgi:hypothetical protein